MMIFRFRSRIAAGRVRFRVVGLFSCLPDRDEAVCRGRVSRIFLRCQILFFLSFEANLLAKENTGQREKHGKVPCVTKWLQKRFYIVECLYLQF